MSAVGGGLGAGRLLRLSCVLSWAVMAVMAVLVGVMGIL